MKINIYGCTGVIGIKSLTIIKKYFPNLKINLITANKNYKYLINLAKIHRPKYVLLNDLSKLQFIKKKLKIYNIKIIHPDEINEFLYKSKSDLSILAISGYQSLNLIEAIFKNTNNLGLVNKECIVAAGHLFKKLSKKNKVNIFPLDSEHFSIDLFFKNFKKKNNIKKILITASGGPFFNKKLSTFSKIKFKEAILHPKWKMGYKNSIDSATLCNKCLELIEAHYLFEIPYEMLDISIHPQALVHSIINFNNYTSILNYFYPDMFIPIFNFINYHYNTKIQIKQKNSFVFNSVDNFDFYDVNLKRYPIVKLFENLNKNSSSEIIKFNTANEVAVENFKLGKIKFNEIHVFIDNSLSLDFTHKTNSINDIIVFQNYFKNLIKN